MNLPRSARADRYCGRLGRRGARLLYVLHGELTRRGIALRVVVARGRVRDLLRADGPAEKVEGLHRITTLHGLLDGPG